MSIVEALSIYLNGCPLLAEDRLNVDFLPPAAQSYSIEPVPCESLVSRYTDGTTVRQFLFVLASRELFGEDIAQQVDNLAFYESFAAWLQRQNDAGILPDLGAGRDARSIAAITCGYAFIPGAETARYQIQCKLKYQEGELLWRE